MALGEDKGGRPGRILLASSALHLIAAAYLIAMAMFLDRTMFHLYAISALSIAAAMGGLRAWRWGLWASLLAAPLTLALAIAALYYSIALSGLAPDVATIAFHVSLLGLAAISIIAALMFLAKRDHFK
ncbi:MAG: hypothetical protein QXU06_02135 [Candidatus Bathyarchaeia archaeon]